VGKTYQRRPQQPEPPVDRERRRVGTLERDDRGNASLRWRDAPPGDERDVLEILGGPLAIKTDDSHDPYARGKAQHKPRAPGRTDLRKLSEHIKKMRELEERKRNEKDEDED
jgi:hypothetical protein